jgi:MFS family permease
VADILPPLRRAEGVGYYGMATNLALAVGPWLSLAVAGALGFTPVFLISAAVATTGVLLAFILRARPFQARAAVGAWWTTLLHRTAFRPAVVFMAFGVTYSAQVSFLPVYAVSKNLGDPGIYFTIYALVLVVSRPFAGKLADRLGRGWAIIPGLLLATISMVLVAAAQDLVFLAGAGALYALSFALVTPALNALLVDAVAPSERGAALATFTASMDVGIGAGAFLWGFVAQTAGFVNLYLFASIVPVIAIGLYLVFVRNRMPIVPATVATAS